MKLGLRIQQVAVTGLVKRQGHFSRCPPDTGKVGSHAKFTTRSYKANVTGLLSARWVAVALKAPRLSGSRTTAQKEERGEMTSRQLLLSKADSLSENEVSEVLEYIGIMESLRDLPGRPSASDDSLLVSWARLFVPQDRRRRMRTLGVKGLGSFRV